MIGHLKAEMKAKGVFEVPAVERTTFVLSALCLFVCVCVFWTNIVEGMRKSCVLLNLLVRGFLL